MTSSEFLSALRSATGLGSLVFNEDSVCCLSVPGRLEVQIEWAAGSGQLLFLAPVGSLDADSGGELARTLLSANFLFRGTRGETLSVEDETGRVFLCLQTDAAAISAAKAVERFTAFLDTAERWSEHFPTLDGQSTEEITQFLPHLRA
jgi:hypothetical protein